MTIIVVTSGTRGLVPVAARLADVARSEGIAIDSRITPPRAVRSRRLRPPRSRLSAFEHARHWRTWAADDRDRRGRLEERIETAAREEGRPPSFVVAGTGPALSALPVAAAHGLRSLVLLDVTVDLHALQNDWKPGRHLRRARALEAERLGHAGRIVTLSAWCRHSLIDDLGLDPARIDVIPPCAPPRPRPAFEARSGPVRLGLIGSPAVRKGMDRALRWLRLRPSAAVELHIFGDRPAVDDDSRIVVHGPVDNAELLAQWLPTLDLVVQPTRRDQSSTTICEAAMAGVPALATTVGGIPELIEDGVTGWLVPRDNDARLFDTLDRLVDDRPALLDAGRAARDRAETHFDASVRYRPVTQWLCPPE